MTASRGQKERNVIRSSRGSRRDGLIITVGSFVWRVMHRFKAILARAPTEEASNRIVVRAVLAIDTTPGPSEMTVDGTNVRLETEEQSVIPGRDVRALRGTLARHDRTKRYASRLEGLGGRTDDGTSGLPAEAFAAGLAYAPQLEHAIRSVVRRAKQRPAETVLDQPGGNRGRLRVMTVLSFGAGSGNGLSPITSAHAQRETRELGSDMEHIALGLLGSTATGRDPKQVDVAVATTLRQLDMATQDPLGAVIDTFDGQPLSFTAPPVDRLYLFSVSNGTVTFRPEELADLAAYCMAALLESPHAAEADAYFENLDTDCVTTRRSLRVCSMGISVLRFDRTAALRAVEALGTERLAARLLHGISYGDDTEGATVRAARALTDQMTREMSDRNGSADEESMRAEDRLTTIAGQVRRLLPHANRGGALSLVRAGLLAMDDELELVQSAVADRSDVKEAAHETLRSWRRSGIAQGVHPAKLRNILEACVALNEQTLEQARVELEQCEKNYSQRNQARRRLERVSGVAEPVTGFWGWIRTLPRQLALRRHASRQFNAGLESCRAQLLVIGWGIRHTQLETIQRAIQTMREDVDKMGDQLASVLDSATAERKKAVARQGRKNGGLARYVPGLDYTSSKANQLWTAERVDSQVPSVLDALDAPDANALRLALKKHIKGVVAEAQPIPSSLADYLEDLDEPVRSILIERCRDESKPPLQVDELSVRPRRRLTFRSVQAKSKTLSAIRRLGLADRLESGCDTRWTASEGEDELWTITEERAIELAEIPEIRRADAALSRTPASVVARFATLYEPEEILDHPLVGSGFSTDQSSELASVAISLGAIGFRGGRRYCRISDNTQLADSFGALVTRITEDADVARSLQQQISERTKRLGKSGVRNRLAGARKNPEKLVANEDITSFLQALPTNSSLVSSNQRSMATGRTMGEGV